MRGYRLHRESLPGKPDISFGRSQIAVFVDGAFWHGHSGKKLPKSNRGYWKAKIARNVERDRRTDVALESAGWHVIRLWDFEIERDPGAAAGIVADAVATRLADLNHATT